MQGSGLKGRIYTVASLLKASELLTGGQLFQNGALYNRIEWQASGWDHRGELPLRHQVYSGQIPAWHAGDTCTLDDRSVMYVL